MLITTKTTNTKYGPVSAAVIYTSANAQLIEGSRCTIVESLAGIDVLHIGTVKHFASGGWIGVQLDGETVTHEWPASQVWSVS